MYVFQLLFVSLGTLFFRCSALLIAFFGGFAFRRLLVKNFELVVVSSYKLQNLSLLKAWKQCN